MVYQDCCVGQLRACLIPPPFRIKFWQLIFVYEPFDERAPEMLLISHTVLVAFARLCIWRLSKIARNICFTLRHRQTNGHPKLEWKRCEWIVGSACWRRFFFFNSSEPFLFNLSDDDHKHKHKAVQFIHAIPRNANGVCRNSMAIRWKNSHSAVLSSTCRY